MAQGLSCMALLPPGLCAWSDEALYLAPSLALAVLIQALSRRHPIFLIFQLAGTLCHELAHFLVGLLTYARPASLSVIPRKSGQGWRLGEVSLARVRWYNAAPAALAPVLILAIPVWIALWRTPPGWQFQPLDLALAFAVAPQFIACWPSAADWRIALRSWPMALLAGLAWFLLRRL